MPETPEWEIVEGFVKRWSRRTEIYIKIEFDSQLFVVRRCYKNSALDKHPEMFGNVMNAAVRDLERQIKEDQDAWTLTQRLRAG